MTITTSVANQPSSASDVAVKFFDQTKFTVTKDSQVLPSGEIFSEYVLNDGSTKVSTLATVRHTPQKDGSVSHSIKVSSEYSEVDSVLGDLVRAPVSVTIAWNAPALVEDPGVLLDLIGSAYSLCFDGVTTKVPNEGTIGKLQRAVTGSLFG